MTYWMLLHCYYTITQLNCTASEYNVFTCLSNISTEPMHNTVVSNVMCTYVCMDFNNMYVHVTGHRIMHTETNTLRDRYVCVVGTGDIDILVSDYCKAKISPLYITIIDLTVSTYILKTVYRSVKL